MKSPCIAFKMNYCDGGQDNDHIGFYGICSDKNIRYNIRKAKRPWCSHDDCMCKKYLDGKISRQELDSYWEPEINGDFVCHESALLRDWVCYAGSDADGTPRSIRGGEANHLCVLTAKYPIKPKSSRLVFAMFIIHEIFEGDDEDAGYVVADDYWRLEFRPHEAEQINFWDFYQNKDGSTRWSGLFRYFDDATAVKFLERAVEVKRGTPKENFAKEFLKHYPYK